MKNIREGKCVCCASACMCVCVLCASARKKERKRTSWQNVSERTCMAVGREKERRESTGLEE